MRSDPETETIVLYLTQPRRSRPHLIFYLPLPTWPPSTPTTHPPFKINGISLLFIPANKKKKQICNGHETPSPPR